MTDTIYHARRNSSEVKPMKRENRFTVAVAVVSIPVMILAGNIVADNMAAIRSDRLDAVGGVDAYKAGRLAALESLRKRAESIPDSDVRESEIVAIERQIDEIENEHIEEIGSEAKRIK